MVRTAYFFRRKCRKLCLTSLASFLNAAKYFVRLIGHFPSSHHEFHRKSDRIIESAVICYH